VQIVQKMRFRVLILSLHARVWNNGRNVCTVHVLVNVLQSVMNVIITTDVWTTIPQLAAVSFTFLSYCRAKHVLQLYVSSSD